MRLGFTAPNFPRPQTYFDGEIDQIRFYQRRLDSNEFAATVAPGGNTPDDAAAIWDLLREKDGAVADVTGNGHRGTVLRGTPISRDIVAGLGFCSAGCARVAD